MGKEKNKISELSIKKILINYFKNKNYYIDDNLIKGDVKKILRDLKINKEEINLALKHAYNTKYGKWEKVNDLREFSGLNWCKALREIINNEIINYEPKRVLIIGSNDGRELNDIFNNQFKGMNFTLIDLSNDAIEKAKKRFITQKKFKYINDDFVNHNFKEVYDIIISLRTIQSSVIDIDMALSKIYEISSKKGLILLSISNGYISQKGEPIYGMHNPITNQILKKKPYLIGLKILDFFGSNNFKSLQMIDETAEILLTIKRD